MTVARSLATLLLLCGFALAATYLFANAQSGTFGFTSVFADGRPVARVDTVEPRGAAARAGVRPGDELTVRRSERAALYLFANPPIVAAADAVTLDISRGGRSHAIRLTAERDRLAPAGEAIYFCVLGIPLLLLGWFIAWRRADYPDALALGTMLLLFGLWIVTPDRVGDTVTRLVLYEILSSACVIVATVLAAIFFARYPDGRGVHDSHVRRIVVPVAIAAGVAQIALMAIYYASPPLFGALPFLNAPALVLVAVAPLATIVCIIDAFRHGTAADRTRLRWLGGSYLAGMAGPVLIPPATFALGSRFTVVDQAMLESTMFVLGFGLTYGILRRRVVDVQFVLNRALVFSAVSSIVIAAFIGVEWLIGSLFVHLSRTTSLMIELGFAVVIGFTLRPIHGYVDGFVDRFFFAKRHAAERAIHHLATEVHFIRDRDTLLERVERDLLEHTDATVVSVYFRDDVRGDFLLQRSTAPNAAEYVDADDDAAVALAVTEGPVELHRRRTRIAGELAVPLAVRKTLLGILVMGEKVNGEAFAPDEIESLRFLAAYLGTALAANTTASLSGAHGDDVLREILAEMRLHRAELRALNDALGTDTTRAESRRRR